MVERGRKEGRSVMMVWAVFGLLGGPDSLNYRLILMLFSFVVLILFTVRDLCIY